MRILYHHRTQAQDAQGIHISEMIAAFRSLGHTVVLSAISGSDSSITHLGRGLRWESFRAYTPACIYELLSLAYNIWGYLRLAVEIKKERPDLIYERYSLNTFCGIWASRRFNIPHILEVNAPLYLEQLNLKQLAFRKFAAFSERWICSNSTWTITVTEAMKQLLVKEGVPPSRVVVMHNAINPKVFRPDISGSDVRKHYGLGSSIVIGFVGWFRPWHGLEKLINTLYASGAFENNVSVLLVGDGPATMQLKIMASNYGVASSVIFTGPVHRDEIPAYIATMDIAVQPSVTDYACPMKLIEYMAMGRCIVAPSQPNIREIVTDGVNGLLFAPGDNDSFSNILTRAIHNPVLRASIGREALKTINDRRLQWTENAKRVLDLGVPKDILNN